jgi:hypothetical protein
LNDQLIAHAKQHAERTGKSVSQMFAHFVAALDDLETKRQPDAENDLNDELLPITRSLLGILKSDKDDEYKQVYHSHLEEK